MHSKKIKYNFISRLINYIVGDQTEFSLEHRFLNSLIFVAGIINFISFFMNLLMELGPMQVYFTLTGIFICFTLFYFARYRKVTQYITLILYIFFFLSITSIWFENNGISGTIPFIYFLIFASIIIISKGTTRIILLTLASLHLIALILFEYFYPDYITHYSTRKLMFIDVGITLFYTILINCFLVALIMKSYNEKKEKAEEADRLKSAFLANMSHEIRTPLNAIIGFADLLNEPNVDEKKRNEFIKIIETNGNHLLSLINDIIDISKIEAGQLNLNITSFSVNLFLDEIKQIYIHKIIKEKPKISLITNYSLQNNNDIITTDAIRLRQIIINLLNNSLNHTREGFIELGYTIEPNSLIFYIKDTGAGIPKEMHDMIFNRFMQANNNLNKKTKGTGLGLTIVKSLVNVLGGKIWMESEAGKGSTFYFTITYDNQLK